MLFAANNNIDSAKNDKLNELKVKFKPSLILIQKSKQTTYLTTFACGNCFRIKNSKNPQASDIQPLLFNFI